MYENDMHLLVREVISAWILSTDIAVIYLFSMTQDIEEDELLLFTMSIYSHV